MAEWIMKEETDMDGVNCYIRTGQVIRCKDCKHRPTIDGEYENGFSIVFPDGRCPCQCDDGWYNWMPEDDWYCGNAERKEHETDLCG